ncbi:hypothetical protein [Geodermatophilus sp. URMC 63]
MDDRNAQVGWTEAQWNRVREEVLRAWHSVRVAGSFLPAYGAMPPNTKVVPSEKFRHDGTIDERSTATLLEISLPVTLSRQQVLEEDLSSALLQLRRRATQLGQLEDWYIFNGTYPPDDDYPSTGALVIDGDFRLPVGSYRPSYSFVGDSGADDSFLLDGAVDSIVGHKDQIRGLLLRNPGALGLMGGAREVDTQVRDVYSVRTQKAQRKIDMQITDWSTKRLSLSSSGLIDGIVDAKGKLEEYGYSGASVCVFGRDPFKAAHQPVGNSTSYPRDRLEPLLGRELLYSSAIDIPPCDVEEFRDKWRKRGVLVSLAGSAVDLAISAEATPEFRQINEGGRYVFSVFERFTLRIKDPRAIVPLQFY